MASDWLKMSKDLLTHPKVVRISSALKADRFRTVGGLFAVWCLFDTHTVDGRLIGYTPEILDESVGIPGIASAMESVGWLSYDEEGLEIPDFEDHNGQSAKRRAQDSDRKNSVRKLSASEADKKRTREEKRREEINTPLTPKGVRFAEFWSAWPSSPRKVAKAECEKRWKARSLDEQADAILSHVETCRSSKQWTDGYEPAPLTFLNQQRWLDGGEDNEPQRRIV